jgi:hypothetical protein
MSFSSWLSDETGYQLLTRSLVSIGHRCIERAAVALDDTGRSTSVRTRIHR